MRKPIKNAFRSISRLILERVQQNFIRRRSKLTEMERRAFEHFLQILTKIIQLQTLSQTVLIIFIIIKFWRGLPCNCFQLHYCICSWLVLIFSTGLQLFREYSCYQLSTQLDVILSCIFSCRKIVSASVVVCSTGL